MLYFTLPAQLDSSARHRTYSSWSKAEYRIGKGRERTGKYGQPVILNCLNQEVVVENDGVYHKTVGLGTAHTALQLHFPRNSGSHP